MKKPALRRPYYRKCRGALPAYADARFSSRAVWYSLRLADANLGHLRLGVVGEDILCGLEYERLFELEPGHADEILHVLRQLRVVDGMDQVVVLGGKGKIKPDGYVHDHGLLLFPFIGERPEDAVELDVFERDFAGFDYHTKSTIAAVKETAVTPNQRLRANV